MARWGLRRNVTSPLCAAIVVLGLLGLAAGGTLLATRSMPAYLSGPSDHAATGSEQRTAIASLAGTREARVTHATVFTCVHPSPSHGPALASAGSSIVCDSGPLVVGSLRRGSSAAQARAEAEASGYEIPPNYVPQPANNGQGWVFRAPGTTSDADIVRVGEVDAQNPTGYVRYYNSEGQPLNDAGTPGPNSDTHLPLRSEPGSSDDPLGDDFFDLGFTAALGGIIYP